MSLEEATNEVEIRKFTEEVLKKNVAKGADLLDNILPGWADVINVRRLKIKQAMPDPNTGDACILCQLDHFISEESRKRLPGETLEVEDFGNYSEAVEIIQWEIDDDFEGDLYGFDLSNNFRYKRPGLTADREYAILDELWKEEIEDRVSK